MGVAKLPNCIAVDYILFSIKCLKHNIITLILKVVMYKGFSQTHY